MASRDDDKAMAGLLQKSLAGDSRAGASANIASAAGKDCPEPEILAAYFDRTLDAEETARYDLHFSQCTHCREQLAAMARASDDAGGDKKSASAWNWLRTPTWLTPAAAAFALLVVIVGITLHKQHATQVANEIAMSRPESAPIPTPESRMPESLRPGQPANAAPTAPSSLAESSRNQVSSANSAREKSSVAQALEAQPQKGRKKELETAKPSPPPQNTPATPQPSVLLSDKNAAVGQAPPTISSGLDVAPRKSVPDSAATDAVTSEVTPEAEAKRPSASKAKASPRVSAAPATAASGSRAAAGSSFAAHNALESAARARMQQMQFASNLSGLTVRTPDSNVLWLVSGGGDVGRSEDGGATWKFASLGVHGLFVSGSSPTAKICWLLAEHGAIFRTTDGKTWTEVPFPAAANDSEFQHIDATDELTATVTQVDGRKFSTSDGGKTWMPTK
jgi:hypothetical protein